MRSKNFKVVAGVITLCTVVSMLGAYLVPMGISLFEGKPVGSQTGGVNEVNTLADEEVAYAPSLLETISSIEGTDYVTFSMLGGVSEEELLTLDGRKVLFFGYQTVDHSSEGSMGDYMIVSYQPEGWCTYHTADGIELGDILHSMPVAFTDSAIRPEYSYVPLKIEGVIKAETVVDSLEHTFNVYIDAMSVTPVEAKETQGILTQFIDLANTGVLGELRHEQVKVDRALGYKVFGLTIDDLEAVDIEKLKVIREVVVDHDSSLDDEYSLKDVLTSIDLAIEVGEFVNEVITSGDITKFGSDEDVVLKTIELFELYQRWLLKFSV